MAGPPPSLIRALYLHEAEMATDVDFEFDSDDESHAGVVLKKMMETPEPVVRCIARHARGLRATDAVSVQHLLDCGGVLPHLGDVLPHQCAPDAGADLPHAADARVREALDTVARGAGLVESGVHLLRSALERVERDTDESTSAHARRVSQKRAEVASALWLGRQLGLAASRACASDPVPRPHDASDWSLRLMVDVTRPWELDFDSFWVAASELGESPTYSAVGRETLWCSDLESQVSTSTVPPGLPTSWCEAWGGESFMDTARTPCSPLLLCILCGSCGRWGAELVPFGADDEDRHPVTDACRTRLTGRTRRRDVCCAHCGILMREWLRAYCDAAFSVACLVPLSKLRQACMLYDGDDDVTSEMKHDTLVAALGSAVGRVLSGRCVVYGAGEVLTDYKLHALLGTRWWEFSDNSRRGGAYKKNIDRIGAVDKDRLRILRRAAV
jgi:hypothetical protein